jgi:MFS family permease
MTSSSTPEPAVPAGSESAGMPTPPATPKGPSLARHPDFLKLWSAETISVFGTNITQLALPLVAAVTLDVGPFEFGLLTTIEFLPFILLSLPAGVWVDRLPRRPILISGDLGRAVTLGSIPVAYALGVLTIWQLYVVGFLTGCLTVFFDVAYQSYLPSLVERDQLVEGNSKLEVSRSASQILGPGLAGVLVGLLKAPFAIALDAASYVASALLLLWIRRAEPPIEPHDAATGPRPSMRSEAAAGLRYVVSHRWLRSIAATTGSSNFFGNISGAILVLYLVRSGLSAEAIGLAFSDAGPDVDGLLPGGTPRGDRAPGGPLRRRRARWLPGWLLLGGLEHQPGLAPPGDHAHADAGPDERLDALHRLGHDAGRIGPGGGARRAYRPPRDDHHRRHRRAVRLRAGRALGGPPPGGDAGAGRGLTLAAHAAPPYRPGGTGRDGWPGVGSMA